MLLEIMQTCIGRAINYFWIWIFEFEFEKLLAMHVIRHAHCRQCRSGSFISMFPLNHMRDYVLATQTLHKKIRHWSDVIIWNCFLYIHCNDVIKSGMASQITAVSIVYLTVSSGTDQKKTIKVPRHWPLWILGWLVNSLHKGPITRKMFPLMTSSC